MCIRDRGTLTLENLATVQRLVQISQDNLNAARANSHFASAFALQVSIANLLQSTGMDGFQTDAAPFLNQARDSACAVRSAAIDAAAAAPDPLPVGDFERLSRPILYWDAAAQMMGGEPCGGASASDAVGTLTLRQFSMVRNAYQSAYSQPADLRAPTARVKDAMALKNEVVQLQRVSVKPPLYTQLVDIGVYATRFQADLIQPAISEARSAAWTVRKEGNVLEQYVDLYDAFGASTVLQQDVQYQGTEISFETRDGTDFVLDVLRAGTYGNNDGPTDPVRSGRMGLRSGSGYLEMSGNLRRLNCGAAVNDGEAVRVFLDGALFTTMANSSVLGDWLWSNDGIPARLRLNSEDLLQFLSLPNNHAGVHTLELRRTGSTCGARMGITDDVLVTVTLDFGLTERPIDTFMRCTEYLDQRSSGYDLPDAPPSPYFQFLRSPITGKMQIHQRAGYYSSFDPQSNMFAAHVYDWPQGALSATIGAGLPFANETGTFTFSMDEQGRRHLKGGISNNSGRYFDNRGVCWTECSSHRSFDAVCVQDRR